MADIIGLNTIGSNTGSILNESLACRNPGDFYTAVAGDSVVEMGWYGSDSLGLGLVLSLAVYTVTAGAPDVREGAVQTVNFNNTGKQWVVATGFEIALVAGTTYTVAFSVNSTTRGEGFNLLTDALSRNSTLGCPATWTELSDANRLYSNYALVEHNPGGSAVNPGDETLQYLGL